MRLEGVRRGQGIRRLLFPIMGWRVRTRLPDIIRTILYRPEFFGKSHSLWTQAVLRGPSPWNVWERELIASFTSACNDCVF
ncbi:MAG: hypothetical protein WAM82_14335 [Thermoanaerobaculia bacterium]